MLTSADEASYFTPARNYIENGVWKDNSVGFSSYYQRPPAYGGLFYVCSKISPENPYLILKISQVVIWGFTVFLMGKILLSFIRSRLLVLTLTTLYGLLPMFNGFTYYTLTESLIPFVVVSLIYVSLKQKYSFFMFVYFGVMLLFRPQVSIIIIGLITFYYLKYYKVISYKIVFIQFLLFILPWSMWSVRNYNVNNEIVSIHPIYHYSNNQMYRPIHAQMTNLFRVWEANPTVFHSQMHQLFNDTTLSVRETVYNQIPIFNQIESKKEIMGILKEYQLVSFLLQTNFSSSSYITKHAIPSEQLLVDKIEITINSLKTKYWQSYYFVTPFKSFKKLIISSSLNLQIFQFKYRGLIWMEALRWFCFILSLAGFITLFYNFITKKVVLWLRLLSMSSLGYIFYLSYVQRLNEDRYYVVILPILFISLIYSILQILGKEKPHSN